MTWTEILAPIKNTEYFERLWQKVKEEYAAGKCFPPKNQIFRALELTPFDEVKVVIIGQDPKPRLPGREGMNLANRSATAGICRRTCLGSNA